MQDTSSSAMSLHSSNASVSNISEQDSEDVEGRNSDAAGQSGDSDENDSDANDDRDLNNDSDLNDDSDANNDNSDGGSIANSDVDSIISGNEDAVYDSDDGDDIPQNPRIALYPGCRITLEESRLLIISFALRFGLSEVAIEHLLKIINCHLPEDEYDSLYLFAKDIPAPALVNVEFLCSDCQRLVTFADGENNVHCECGVLCNQKTLKKEGHFFLRLPLKDQILALFQNREVRESLRWDSESESDVICGRVYQAGVNQGLIRKNCDISLQFNTDGIQLFGSSTIQTWPIQVAINELPFRLRNQNIILCGLWYGEGKPNMNSFLSPFVDELNDLHVNGVYLPTEPPRLVKVHTLLCPVDSMARAPLQNLKTFRGAYGCPSCLHPGEELEVGIRGGKTRLYRGGLHQLRNARQHLADVNSIVEQRGRGRRRARDYDAIRGIKGASVLMTLHLFDIVDSFVSDYLHCVLLGVVKTMFTWWTLKRNNKKDFYFGNDAKLDAIDAVLLSIKPPSEITKTPQTIYNYKLWKGHEWKNFLLYYSLPCLKAINFPPQYLKHWFLLVYSMFCFLSDIVTAEKYDTGKAALMKYVLTLEEVYGTAELMKFNTHLLLHIPRSVKNFGALWATSTFPFEHYNGTLSKMFKSSQAVPLQICKNYVRLQGLKEELNNIAQDNRVPHCVRNALESLVCRKTTRHALRIDRDLVLIGASRLGTLMILHLNLVQNLINARVNNSNVQFFSKFIYKNVKHHVQDCLALEKRMNCVVQLVNNAFISITHVLKIRTDEENPRTFVVILGFKLMPTNDTLIDDRQLGLSSNLFLTVVDKSNECVAILPSTISRKCLLTFYPGDPLKFCCYPLVNLVERD